MFIIGIDPGIKNFAYYIGKLDISGKDKNSLSHLKWGNISLQRGIKKCAKVSAENLCTTIIKDFYPNHIEPIIGASKDYIIIIEKQKQPKLKLLANTLWARHFGKCIMVHAVDVKKHFNLKFGEGHSKNKERMVDKMTPYVSSRLLTDKRNIEIINNPIDAMALCLYYILKHYNKKKLAIGKNDNTLIYNL